MSGADTIRTQMLYLSYPMTTLKHFPQKKAFIEEKTSRKSVSLICIVVYTGTG